MFIMVLKLWRAVADLLFPRCCEVCGRELLLNEKFLCLECYAQLPFTYFWKMEENPAERAFWGRARIEGVCSLFYYTDSYKKLVHALKYRSNVEAGLWMGQMLGSRIPFPTDYIIPVPLHWRKQWLRGYNQSEIIARGVVKGIISRSDAAYGTEDVADMPECGLSGNSIKRRGERAKSPKIVIGLLQRRIFTQTQTHKDKLSRWQSVSRAFRLNPAACKKYDLNGKNVLIIDDVMTSGATLDACANLLLTHYDCKVYIATLAYVE